VLKYDCHLSPRTKRNSGHLSPHLPSNTHALLNLTWGLAPPPSASHFPLSLRGKS
jgi:hypothetical protein